MGVRVKLKLITPSLVQIASNSTASLLLWWHKIKQVFSFINNDFQTAKSWFQFSALFHSSFADAFVG